MVKLIGLLSVLIFLTVAPPSRADDEAEEKKVEPPAPHQGRIEVAGPYRLELILEKDGTLKIYLLDKDLKNEMVQNSEVGVFVKSGNTESEMTCKPIEVTHFECKQTGKKFKKGELLISSRRDNIRAEEIKLKFPFEK